MKTTDEFLFVQGVLYLVTINLYFDMFGAIYPLSKWNIFGVTKTIDFDRILQEVLFTISHFHLSPLS